MQLLKSVENYGKGCQYAGKFTLMLPQCIDGTWDMTRLTLRQYQFPGQPRLRRPR